MGAFPGCRQRGKVGGDRGPRKTSKEGSQSTETSSALQKVSSLPRSVPALKILTDFVLYFTNGIRLALMCEVGIIFTTILKSWSFLKRILCNCSQQLGLLHPLPRSLQTSSSVMILKKSFLFLIWRSKYSCFFCNRDVLCLCHHTENSSQIKCLSWREWSRTSNTASHAPVNFNVLFELAALTSLVINSFAYLKRWKYIIGSRRQEIGTYREKKVQIFMRFGFK